MKIFPRESSTLWRQWRRCLRVSLPSWGAVVGTCVALGLRVKTLDHLGLDDGDALRRYSPESVVGEFRFPSGSSVSCVASLAFLILLFSTFDLLCKGSPHHSVSVRPFDFIYKVGRKPISSILSVLFTVIILYHIEKKNLLL